MTRIVLAILAAFCLFSVAVIVTAGFAAMQEDARGVMDGGQ